MGVHQRDIETNGESSQWPKLKQFERQNEVTYYNLKYKISIYKLRKRKDGGHQKENVLIK